MDKYVWLIKLSVGAIVYNVDISRVIYKEESLFKKHVWTVVLTFRQGHAEHFLVAASEFYWWVDLFRRRLFVVVVVLCGFQREFRWVLQIKCPGWNGFEGNGEGSVNTRIVGMVNFPSNANSVSSNLIVCIKCQIVTFTVTAFGHHLTVAPFGFPIQLSGKLKTTVLFWGVS